MHNTTVNSSTLTSECKSITIWGSNSVYISISNYKHLYRAWENDYLFFLQHFFLNIFVIFISWITRISNHYCVITPVSQTRLNEAVRFIFSIALDWTNYHRIIMFGSFHLKYLPWMMFTKVNPFALHFLQSWTLAQFAGIRCVGSPVIYCAWIGNCTFIL